MVNCSYCGAEIKKGTGKIFVKDNGTVINLCSSKCEKYIFKLGRDARKFKWTAFYEKGKTSVSKNKTKNKK